MSSAPEDVAALEAFIAAFDPRPVAPPPPSDMDRARRIAQLLRDAGARPDIVAAFDRAAASMGLPGTIDRAAALASAGRG